MKSVEFDQMLFSSYLECKWISKIHYFKTIDSTNSFLKNQTMLQNGELAIAETQTSGRGRRGRTWKDAPFENLLFSLSYKPTKQSEFFTVIPLLAALAVAKVCQNYLEGVEIKWPNDVLVNGQKISGLLVESKSNGSESLFIIGIGLNVNQNQFDTEIINFATSFYKEKKLKFEREKILAEIINILFFYLKDLEINETDSQLSEYSSLCSTLKRAISFEHEGEVKTGVALKIQKSGALLIHMGNTEISFHGNEIFHIR